MTLPLLGTTPTYTTTVTVPTSATTFTVASAAGFQAPQVLPSGQTLTQRIQVKVGGVFQATNITNIVGNVLTVSPALGGVPDSPGAVEWRGVPWTIDLANTWIAAINAAATQTQINALQNRMGATDAFGNGSDGQFYLGVIGAPIPANAPTISDSGVAGSINGATVSVKIAAYNMSGEQVATVASNTISVTNKQIDVVIPAYASANITGYKIFLSYNGITYFYVASANQDSNTINNAAAGLTFRLNTKLTSGTAPVGANTTTSAPAAGIVGGVYNCTGGTAVGTITLNTALPYLVILSVDELDMSGCTIQAGGVGSTKGNRQWVNSINGLSYTWGNPAGVAGQPVFGTGFPVTASDYLFANSDFSWWGTQGGSSVNQTGGSVYIAAKNYLKAGLVFASGSGAGGFGCAGGFICHVSKVIDRSLANCGAIGSTALVNRGSGGGGIIAWIYEQVIGAGVNTVTGGAAPGGAGGNAGGGFGGAGGVPGAAGAVGIVMDRTLRSSILPRWA